MPYPPSWCSLLASYLLFYFLNDLHILWDEIFHFQIFWFTPSDDDTQNIGRTDVGMAQFSAQGSWNQFLVIILENGNGCFAIRAYVHKTWSFQKAFFQPIKKSIHKMNNHFKDIDLSSLRPSSPEQFNIQFNSSHILSIILSHLYILFFFFAEGWIYFQFSGFMLLLGNEKGNIKKERKKNMYAYINFPKAMNVICGWNWWLILIVSQWNENQNKLWMWIERGPFCGSLLIFPKWVAFLMNRQIWFSVEYKNFQLVFFYLRNFSLHNSHWKLGNDGNFNIRYDTDKERKTDEKSIFLLMLKKKKKLF